MPILRGQCLTRILLRDQQPFDIGPTQLNAFKRVNASSNIGWDSAAPSKVALTIAINFWFGTP